MVAEAGLPDGEAATAVDGAYASGADAAAEETGGHDAAADAEDAAAAAPFKPAFALDTLTGVDAVLCDGQPGITFYARLRPGGLGNIGRALMSEHGSSFFIVDGSCHYFAQFGQLARVVSGALTPQDVQVLRQSFQLERFQELTGDYGSSAADAGSFEYALGRGGFTTPCAPFGEYGGCIGRGSTVPREEVAALAPAFYDTLLHYSEIGAPYDGAVRYLLMPHDGSTNDPRLWGNPASWPLGEAGAIAWERVRAASYGPVMSDSATGTDADALRDLWQRFLDYEVSGRYPNAPAAQSDYLPIRQGGVHYRLFIRDSLPYEDPRGLIAY